MNQEKWESKIREKKEKEKYEDKRIREFERRQENNEKQIKAN